MKIMAQPMPEVQAYLTDFTEPPKRENCGVCTVYVPVSTGDAIIGTIVTKMEQMT